MAAFFVRLPGTATVSQAVSYRRAIKVASSLSTKITSQQGIRGMNTVSAKKEVNGVELHHEVAGQGSHVVLCMPGALGSTQSDFGPQLKGLSDEFTVIAFDPRGYGKSIPPKRDFPPDFFARDADDAAGLMDALGKLKYAK